MTVIRKFGPTRFREYEVVAGDEVMTISQSGVSFKLAYLPELPFTRYYVWFSYIKSARENEYMLSCHYRLRDGKDRPNMIQIIGSFASLTDAQDFLRGVAPLLPELPADQLPNNQS